VYALERAKLMLDCWRTGGANSPETFITAVAAVLARYPDHVIFEVTNPMSGLPIELTWMPSIKDVHDACEKMMEPIYRRQRHEAMLEKHRAERAEQEEIANRPRPTLDELKAKYGENWGLSSLDKPERKAKPAPTKEELAAHYRQYGLAFKPKHHEGADSGTDKAQATLQSERSA
jgi:hypothetical protein